MEKNGQYTKLTHDSAIISKIPKQVRNVRIFADASEALLAEVGHKITELEKAQ